MKIGILSYPLNNNYGCYLQAYALSHTLQQMGHDVTYIHRRHNKPNIKYRVQFFIRTLKKFILERTIRNPFYRFEWLYMGKKGKRMLPFFEEHIPHTTPYYTSKALERHCQGYDAIIVGSDQVWRSELLHSIEDYYLAFLKNQNTIRVAYAASFGKIKAGYSKSQIHICGKLIEKFDAISVREQSGQDLIRQFEWNVQTPTLVLDPTMLLTKEDYLKLCIKDKLRTKDKNIHCYILDATYEKQNLIQSVSRLLKKDAVDFLQGKDHENFLYPSVQEWLEAFMTSDFIITDSFHGTVFSIIFNVPFLVIANVQRGAERITSLLSMLGLTERLYDADMDLQKFLSAHIDWNIVNEKLMEQKILSMNFLTNALNKKKSL